MTGCRFEFQVIPAGDSAALRLRAGQRVKVINTSGTQVVDCWAFALDDPREAMSMEHTRVEIQRVAPRAGDQLFTNRRRPVLTFVEDTSPGVHDTTLAACDVYRYQRLGARGYHRNCTDNLAQAIRAAGLDAAGTPCPLNLWENARVQPDGSLIIASPVSAPGDYVVLRAELDLLLVFSACPQDMAPTNGPDATPRDAHFVILD
ncbi:MAG TPA: urea carboxylase-associated family protein [Streptosporangiaceae bacterium]